jgi:vacuolar-type H+-ATPase subunit I/STV1
MGNRPAGYWILVIIAIAVAIASFKMSSSPDAHTHQIARYMGFGGIALLLIARFLFPPKRDTAPPIPKD